MYFWSLQKAKQKVEGTEQQQTYKFTQGYNILHMLQVPPNPNLYHTQQIFINIYVHTYVNSSSQLNE